MPRIDITPKAPIESSYIVVAADGTLTSERILTGTSNQITVTDGGAGGNITLSTPQDIATISTPQFANLIITSGGDIRPSANSTTALNIANAAGTDFVTFDTTNSRVGIGTTGPGYKLDVVGDRARIVSSEIYGLTFGRSGVLGERQIGISSHASAPDMYFTSHAGAELVTITNAGNVGIGTTGPNAIFEVYGSSPLPRITNTNTAGWSSLRFYEGSTLLGRLQQMGSTFSDAGRQNDFEILADVGDLSLGAGGNLGQVYIKTTGNVGIGTTGPGAKLHVVGGYIVADGTYGMRNYGVGTIGDTNTEFLRTYHNGAGAGGGVIGVDKAGTGTYRDMSFQTSGFTQMTIDTNGDVTMANELIVSGTGNSSIAGNVGIGTTSPTNLLSLGGNAARIFWMERHTTANTAGNNLTVQSGGATSGATDKAGGNLILAPGLSTGTGTNSVLIQTSPVGTTGTSDNALVTRVTVDSNEINLNWGLKIRRTATAVSYTVLVTDYYIGVTSTAAARTITLPVAATAGEGKTFVIKDESGACATNNIIIDGNASETVDGATTYTMATNYESVTLVCDGSSWFIT